MKARTFTTISKRAAGVLWKFRSPGGARTVASRPGLHAFTEKDGEGGMALPVSYDAEALEWLSAKLRELRQRTGWRLLLENPALLTPLPEMELDEPSFLNALFHQGDCGVLLDLHNLWVSARNGGLAVERYLERLNPDAVVEVHLVGGEELFGVYTDSHSRLTPQAVWSIAQAYLPCCPNLRAITFEIGRAHV